ncbi:hypothetical protein LOZ66_001544 [Ophidiomyces ophidiicola]|nr:hypothetical protein LOZ66_001544 [Ophidiomyces ophidiicola]
MALSIFGHANNPKYFDIRLDDDYIVFRGSPEEAASAHLKGTLVLCLSEPFTIKHLKLRLVGVSRIGWTLIAGPLGGSKKQIKEHIVFEKTWKFRDAGKGKTEIMPADNYEFPFDVVLPGSLPESVEGLADSWVTYRLKAEIGRKYAKDIHARKPLRIIRTLDPTALEFAHLMVQAVENIWPNKLEYSISLANKAVIFGTSITVNFRLLPLVKGLKIGNILAQLVESHELTLPPDEVSQQRKVTRTSKLIFSHSFEIEEQRDFFVPNADAEGYRFSKTWSLPTTLRKCLQDADTQGIKIKHKLKFRVQLHNSDGHTSELRASLPVHIFISPNLPIDENNNIIDQSHNSVHTVDFYLAQQAPPLYGEHRFDQLYGDMDPNGYFTPGTHSGVASPLESHSRNLSAENLTMAPAGRRGGDICAHALHNRLTDLHLLRRRSSGPPATPPPEPLSTAPADDPHHPQQQQQQQQRRRRSLPTDALPSIMGELELATTDGGSRRSSEDAAALSGLATPNPHFSEVEDLCRVPSYSTALRSSAKTHYDRSLPNYQAATASNPPSPTAVAAAAAAAAAVARVGVRRAHSRRTSRLFGILEAPARPHFSLHQRGSSADPSMDSERQLRIMQARAGG